MRREQLRSHVRLLAKHRGSAAADRARLALALTLAIRSLVELGSRRREDRGTAGWLAGTPTSALLAEPRST